MAGEVHTGRVTEDIAGVGIQSLLLMTGLVRCSQAGAVHVAIPVQHSQTCAAQRDWCSTLRLQPVYSTAWLQYSQGTVQPGYSTARLQYSQATVQPVYSTASLQYRQGTVQPEYNFNPRLLWHDRHA